MKCGVENSWWGKVTFYDEGLGLRELNSNYMRCMFKDRDILKLYVVTIQ